jgi:Ca2+-binding EF-hand superfamily protein
VKRWLVACCLLPFYLLVLSDRAGVAFAEPAVEKNSPDAADPNDITALLLADERPVVLRLRVRLNGRPLSEVWREHAQEMFAFVDLDKNGLVSEVEFRNGPWRNLESTAHRGNVLGEFFRGFRSAPKGEDVDVGMKLPRFLERFGQRLPPVSVVATTGNRLPTSTFWLALDRNADGRLGRDELLSAPQLLDSWDINEDDQIGTVDLTQYFNPVSQYARAESGTMRPRALIVLSSPVERASAVEKLLMQYQPDASSVDRFLPVDKLKLADGERQRVDRDADGTLNPHELADWLSDPQPELTIDVHRQENVEGPDPGNTLSITRHREGVETCRVLGGGQNYTVFAVAGVRLAIVLDAATAESALNYYQAVFESTDRDNNKYVDQEEAASNGIIAGFFSQMDRDLDGKVFVEDLKALLEQMERLARSRMQLSEVDDGKDLFNLLDISADAQLSRRELRNADALIEHWDANADGQLSQEEIPRGFRITIGRGAMTLETYAEPSPAAVGQDARERPLWFETMDRNGDGDVAANEFVGPIALFDKMDANGDGLLSLDEVPPASPATASDE